jgi:hypothetical protein
VLGLPIARAASAVIGRLSSPARWRCGRFYGALRIAQTFMRSCSHVLASVWAKLTARRRRIR